MKHRYVSTTFIMDVFKNGQRSWTERAWSQESHDNRKRELESDGFTVQTEVQTKEYWR